MPASTRSHLARTTSRPYDRRSPSASPTQSQDSHPSPPPASPIQDPASPPDRPGLPTHAEYKRIEAGYLQGLSPRKRDKALITQAMFDKIWDVLHQPEACTIETPQFRFWVRKMFTLSRPDADSASWCAVSPEAHPRAPTADSDTDSDADAADLSHTLGVRTAAAEDDAALLTSAVVLHEHRPVAIMEQLYELFCYCHVRAGHGGRDKTCAVIRQHYSWVPKELTAQFVKACPTCAVKRSGGELAVVLQRRAAAGARERERERGVRGPAEPVSAGWPMTGGPLDPVMAPDSERGLPGGWHTPPVPNPFDAHTPSTGFFLHPIDATHSPGTGYSLDHLTGPGMRGRSDLDGPFSTTPCVSGDLDVFQIDPVLLSLDYPGLHGADGDGDTTERGLGLGLGLGLEVGTVGVFERRGCTALDLDTEPEEQGIRHIGLYDGRLRPRVRPGVCRMRSDTVQMPALDTSTTLHDSPDSSFERDARAVSAFSEGNHMNAFTSSPVRRRCASADEYVTLDSPLEHTSLEMLLHLS